MKTKIQAKIANKGPKGLYTVSIERMEKYLAQTGGEFTNRVSRQGTQADVAGVLAGPVVRRVR